MIQEFIKWDAADYLVSDTDIADYLTAANETGEAADLAHAVSTVARARADSDTKGACVVS